MRNEIRAALEAIANSWIPKTVLGVFAVFSLSHCCCSNRSKRLLVVRKQPTCWHSNYRRRQAGNGSRNSRHRLIIPRNLLRGGAELPQGPGTYPHLTMRLRVDRVAVSEQYDAIIVTLEAENTGSACAMSTKSSGLSTQSPTTTTKPQSR